MLEIAEQSDSLAVIGPARSLAAAASSSVGAMHLITTVSYGALMSSLNDRESRPFFYRSVPSSGEYGIALGQLMCYFGWREVFVIDSPLLSVWNMMYNTYKETSCGRNSGEFNMYRSMVDGDIFEYADGPGETCRYCQHSFITQVKTAATTFALSGFNIVVSAVPGETSNLIHSSLSESNLLKPGTVFIQVVTEHKPVLNCSNEGVEGLLYITPGVKRTRKEYQAFRRFWNESAKGKDIKYFEMNAYVWDTIGFMVKTLDNVLKSEGNVTRRRYSDLFPETVMTDGAAGVFEFQSDYTSRPANFDIFNLVCNGKTKGVAEHKKVLTLNYYLPPDAENLVYNPNGKGTIKWSTGKTTDLMSYNPHDYLNENVPLSCLKECNNGHCISSMSCVCDDGWTGASCDTEQYFRYDGSISIVFEVLTSVGATLAAGFFLYLLVRRKHSYLATVSVSFIVLPSVGIIILYLSMLCWTGKPTTTTCALRFWMPLVGFTFAVSNFMARTWNLYMHYRTWLKRELDESGTPKVRLSGMYYFWFLLAFGGTQYVILAIFNFIALPDAELRVQVNDPDTVMLQCIADPEWVYLSSMAAMIVINLIWLIFMVAIAVRVSFVFKELSELKVFQFTYVSSFAILVTFGLLVYTLDADQYAYNITTLVCILFLSVSLMFTFLFPICYKVYTLPHVDFNVETAIEMDPENSGGERGNCCTSTKDPPSIEVFGQPNLRLSSISKSEGKGDPKGSMSNLRSLESGSTSSSNLLHVSPSQYIDPVPPSN